MFLSCLLYALATGVGMKAQEPEAPTPATETQGPRAEVLQRALVDADIDSREIRAAANQVMRSDSKQRKEFMAKLRSIAGAAHGCAAPPRAEWPDEARALMVEVAVGSDEQRTAAIARLGALGNVGDTALAQLHERSTSILHRCVVTVIRGKLATNAIFAGQFDELRDFQPEVDALLLEWATEPPKDAPAPRHFRPACLRALRDVMPADHATDAVRVQLKKVAEQARNEDDQTLFVTAICSLHQFGDPAPFDRFEASIAKNAASEDPKVKLQAGNTLAELRYQLRDYAGAAKHFGNVVTLLETTNHPPESLVSVCYNTACTLALAGKIDEAFPYLEKAFEYGARSQQLSKSLVDEDHDTNNLRSDPRFQELMKRYFSGTAQRR
jgi:hypothetical protein